MLPLLKLGGYSINMDPRRVLSIYIYMCIETLYKAKIHRAHRKSPHTYSSYIQSSIGQSSIYKDLYRELLHTGLLYIGPIYKRPIGSLYKHHIYNTYTYIYMYAPYI